MKDRQGITGVVTIPLQPCDQDLLLQNVNVAPSYMPLGLFQVLLKAATIHQRARAQETTVANPNLSHR